MFQQKGIHLRYQNYVALKYGPAERFIPGLSVIDYIMHDGRPLGVAFPDQPAD
jgi:WbqC-like protein family